jgi:hypothetical protein
MGYWRVAAARSKPIGSQASDPRSQSRDVTANVAANTIHSTICRPNHATVKSFTKSKWLQPRDKVDSPSVDLFDRRWERHQANYVIPLKPRRTQNGGQPKCKWKMCLYSVCFKWNSCRSGSDQQFGSVIFLCYYNVEILLSGTRDDLTVLIGSPAMRALDTSN